jgi:hypothetical protein
MIDLRYLFMIFSRFLIMDYCWIFFFGWGGGEGAKIDIAMQRNYYIAQK